MQSCERQFSPKAMEVAWLGGAVRVHGRILGGLKVLFGGGSVGSRTTTKAVLVGVAPKRVRAPLVVPKRCLGGGVGRPSPGGRFGRWRGQCRRRGVEVQAAGGGPTQPRHGMCSIPWVWAGVGVRRPAGG